MKSDSFLDKKEFFMCNGYSADLVGENPVTGAATCLDCRFFLFCQSVKGDSAKTVSGDRHKQFQKIVCRRSGECEEEHVRHAVLKSGEDKDCHVSARVALCT